MPSLVNWVVALRSKISIKSAVSCKSLLAAPNDWWHDELLAFCHIQ
jgi:hypothetical protein